MASGSSAGNNAEARPARLPFPPDPRAFDFSFAFNNAEFSDRTLILEISDDTPSFLLPPPCLSPLPEEPRAASASSAAASSIAAQRLPAAPPAAARGPTSGGEAAQEPRSQAETLAGRGGAARGASQEGALQHRASEGVAPAAVPGTGGAAEGVAAGGAPLPAVSSSAASDAALARSWGEGHAPATSVRMHGATVPANSSTAHQTSVPDAIADSEAALQSAPCSSAGAGPAVPASGSAGTQRRPPRASPPASPLSSRPLPPPPSSPAPASPSPSPASLLFFTPGTPDCPPPASGSPSLAGSSSSCPPSLSRLPQTAASAALPVAALSFAALASGTAAGAGAGAEAGAGAGGPLAGALASDTLPADSGAAPSTTGSSSSSVAESAAPSSAAADRGLEPLLPAAGAPLPGCNLPTAAEARATRSAGAAAESTALGTAETHSVSAAACPSSSSSSSSSSAAPSPPRTVAIHVISAILASQSDFFRSLFSPQWRRPPPASSSGSSPGSPALPHDRVVLRLSSEEEAPFLELLRFMYTGRLASEAPEAVLHVLLVANKFGVLSAVSVAAHQLREVPLSLHTCCILLRVCSGVVLSEAAMFLVASSAAFLVSRFGQLDASWQSPDFLSLPLEAVEAVLGSDEVCVEAEETAFRAALHWVRHHCPDDLPLRQALVARLSERLRFALMDAAALKDEVLAAPEADSPAVREMVQEGLWFKCFSFERQQELIQSTVQQHRRFVRRKQLSIHSEVLLQDCYMLQTGQAILLPGGAWVCGKLFSLKVMRITAPVGGSDFGLFLQASQRCPTQDKVLDNSVSVEFSFKVREWPSGQFVQQKQTASHTFKGLFRERGYRSLLNPWNEVMKDNSRFFRNGVMALRADLRVIQPGEGLSPFE